VNIADRIAARTLAHLRRNPEQHHLLAENLASYVSHYKPDFQAELDRKEGHDLVDRLRSGWAQADHRWVDKIRRDLDKPYTDSEVQQRFEVLESRFQGESQRLIAEHSGAYPAQVFVTGSLVRGRFGAHSDIDAIGVADGPYRPSGYADVSWQLTQDKGKDFLLNSFAETRAVEPGQRLLPIYQQALASRGLHLELQDGNCWRIERRSYPERQPEAPVQTGMIWSFADLP